MTPAVVKRAAHATGALAALHRARNRRGLTVVTLHRVLPASDPRAAECDPRYTITPSLLGECLRFFSRHYNPVGLAQLAAATDGGAPLPPRPLLVTFDDGWTDNLDHGLPELRSAGWPAVVFVAGCAIGAERPFWPERLVAGRRSDRLSAAALAAAWSACGESSPAPGFTNLEHVRTLAARLRSLDVRTREDVLRALPGWDAPTVGRELATAAELRALVEAGIAIGGHGQLHEPLTDVADLDAELGPPRARLAELTGTDPLAVSFPHGRYDGRVVAAARRAGYRFLFTSDTLINPLQDGRPADGLLHRIGLYASDLARADGSLAPERLALELFRREHAGGIAVATAGRRSRPDRPRPEGARGTT
jgi:peptidoglycan/xylan/chitin deacetylase (PgdA/CDA1 family)